MWSPLSLFRKAEPPKPAGMVIDQTIATNAGIKFFNELEAIQAEHRQQLNDRLQSGKTMIFALTKISGDINPRRVHAVNTADGTGCHHCGRSLHVPDGIPGKILQVPVVCPVCEHVTLFVIQEVF